MCLCEDVFMNVQYHTVLAWLQAFMVELLYGVCSFDISLHYVCDVYRILLQHDCSYSAPKEIYTRPALCFGLLWFGFNRLHPYLMMTSSNGNIFHVIGRLCGAFTGHRWVPRTKAKWRVALMFSLIGAWTNCWVNNGEAGDLKIHRSHYDVTVMCQY